MQGRVLIIAGSDSGGGAGIQADLKTVTALGGYGATAITALTAQNTLGVHAIEEVPVDFVAKQIEVVLSDIGADAIKIGMLHRVDVIEAVASQLYKSENTSPIVLDPVMVAKGGASLLADDASTALIKKMLPLAYILTPNIPEAEHLAGMDIRSQTDMIEAGQRLRDMGPTAVMMKGGHMEGAMITDILVTQDDYLSFRHPRIESRHTHGTGCTLSSAIATGIAQDLTLENAVRLGLDYVQEAMKTAPGYGAGHGPLNHGHTVR